LLVTDADCFQCTKPISTLWVFALGALLSGLYREWRYINVEIR